MEPFLNHERMVHDAVQSVVPPALQEVFKAQLATVNLVQRHGDGQEVNMYRKVGVRFRLECAARWHLIP